MNRVGVLLAVPMVALGVSLSCGAVAQAAGTTLYVSPSGSDTNPCTQALPCQTIQHAVDTSLPGGAVKVLAGTYNQTVNITKPLTLSGAGPSKTIIDGSNIDTGAGAGTQDPSAPSSTPYYGVVSVQNNTGPGGSIKIQDFTIDHAYVTATEYSQSDVPADVSIYRDLNPGDSIKVSDTILGAVQDTADYGGIGFDTFNDVAPATFTDSTSMGNVQGALLEGGGVGGKVTVTGVTFTKLVPCAGNCSGSSTVYQPEGVFLLSDQPGTANATISDNGFRNYAGDGIDASAGYTGGNCAGSNGPCTGNVNMTAADNHVTLGACQASQGCAAIWLDAQSGNELTAVIKNNDGTVRRPDEAIVINPDSGVYNVTESGNHIRVI